jgi:hypothetical protein
MSYLRLTREELSYTPPKIFLLHLQRIRVSTHHKYLHNPALDPLSLCLGQLPPPHEAVLPIATFRTTPRRRSSRRPHSIRTCTTILPPTANGAAVRSRVALGTSDAALAGRERRQRSGIRVGAARAGTRLHQPRDADVV